MEVPSVKVGQVYQAKKPKPVGIFEPLYDDRSILYVSQHKSIVKTIDHGFATDYLAWCKDKHENFPSSEHTQLTYEIKTEKLAKNYEHIWDYTVQYDSPTLKFGKKYPTIPLSKFLKWAGKEITSEMPPGEWRKVN